MKLAALVACSQEVRGTRSRKKSAHLAVLLDVTPPDQVATVVAWLSGEPRPG